MKNKFYLLLYTLLSLKVSGQQLFQDGSGKTNLFLGSSPYGWITFNTSDKSASVGYTRNRIDGYDHEGVKWNYNVIYGGDIKVNVKDGTGSIVSGGSLKQGITVSGNVGIFSDDLLQHGHYSTIYLRPLISYTQYVYIDSLPTGLPQVTKVNKMEGGILFNANFQFNFQKSDSSNGEIIHKRHYVFIGVQTGFNVINNYSDLDDIEVNSLLFGSPTSSAYKTETGKYGAYKSYKVLPVNIDLGITPRLFQHNYFGFNTYFRSNFFKEKNDSKAGVGIYLADEKIPSNISGGLAWQFNDIFNTLDKPGGTFKKSSVFFYIGYAIGK